MVYTDNIPEGECPRRGRGFRPGGRSYSPLICLASLYCIIAVMRLMIAVLRLAIIISISIGFLLSFVLPFGNYNIAYSAEYVKGKKKNNEKKNVEKQNKESV